MGSISVKVVFDTSLLAVGELNLSLLPGMIFKICQHFPNQSVDKNVRTKCSRILR